MEVPPQDQLSGHHYRISPGISDTRHYEVGERLTILIHFFLSIEAILEVVHAFIA